VGAGVIGNYDHCFAVSPVQGSFRSLQGADPFDRKIGEINFIVEYKLEVNCRHGQVHEALAARGRRILMKNR